MGVVGCRWFVCIYLLYVWLMYKYKEFLKNVIKYIMINMK